MAERRARDGVIHWAPEAQIIGGHAFAIVAYDASGFWIQNSWADDWGKDGYAQISYDDWLANGSDIWVARLGAPVVLRVQRIGVTQRRRGIAGLAQLRVLRSPSAHHQPGKQRRAQDGRHLRHIRRGREGDLLPALESHRGRTNRPRSSTCCSTRTAASPPRTRRSRKWRTCGPTLLDAGVYPICVHLENRFLDARSATSCRMRSPAVGRKDSWTTSKDFMLDRLDDGLEPVARSRGRSSRVGRDAAERRAGQPEERRPARRAERGEEAPGAGIRSCRCTWWATAPARSCSVRLAGANQAAGGKPVQFEPARCGRRPARWISIASTTCRRFARGSIKQFAIFTLTDRAEQDDNCANIYHKSLLYLVSHAFEKELRKPWFRDADGEPMLGMEKFVKKLPERDRPKEWVLSPNAVAGGPARSGALDDAWRLRR